MTAAAGERELVYRFRARVEGAQIPHRILGHPVVFSGIHLGGNEAQAILDRLDENERLRGLLRDLVVTARSFDVEHPGTGDQDPSDEHVGWLVDDAAFEAACEEVASMEPRKGERA